MAEYQPDADITITHDGREMNISLNTAEERIKVAFQNPDGTLRVEEKMSYQMAYDLQRNLASQLGVAQYYGAKK